MGDSLRYLAVALVWTLAGRALLTIARQHALGTLGWLVSPVIAQAFVAVTLGICAARGIPIQTLSTLLWGLLCALAVAWLGLEGLRTSKAAPGDPRLLVALALIVPPLTLLPYFVHGFGGYIATTHPDAWSYVAFGDYLLHYPRMTHGGLSPLHQWAFVLSETRYVSASELAWLSAITREGDTQAAFGLALTLTTFIMAAACAGAASVLRLPSWLALLVGVIGGAGNWVTNAILVSNLDNLQVLSCLPAIAVLGLDTTRTPTAGRVALVALLATGALYTYPELAIVSLCCGTLFFAKKFSTQPLRRSVVCLCACAAIVAVAITPFARQIVAFFLVQLGSGMTGQARPAELVFAGLLDQSRWPAALWGLGPETSTTAATWWAGLAGTAVSLLFLLGLGRLAIERQTAALGTLAVLAAGFGVFVWRLTYGYGAYKFILLGWWLVCVALAFGIDSSRRVHRAAPLVATIIAVTALWASATRATREAITAPEPEMRAFRALGGAAFAAGGAPIAVAVEDATAAHWATYFLRTVPMQLVSSIGYLALPHVQPAMVEAKTVPWTALRLLLTDATDKGPFLEHQNRWTPLWGNKSYTLWDTGDAGWAVAWKIDNGYPHSANPDVVWIADQPVTIVATANSDGVLRIRADLATTRPLSAEDLPVRVRSDDGFNRECEWPLRQGVNLLALGLRAGANTVTLNKTAPRAVTTAPEAAAGVPLMVGLAKPTVAFDRVAPTAIPNCQP